jgi:hypothetical protein
MGALRAATFVTDLYDRLKATITGSNTVKISRGVGFLQGIQYEVDEFGQELTFPGYTPAGPHRHFIAVRYIRNPSTAVETIDLGVVPGNDYSPAGGHISEGAERVEECLYSVVVGKNGLAAIAFGCSLDNYSDYLESPVGIGKSASHFSHESLKRQYSKSLYESNEDTNAFTDLEKARLAEVSREKIVRGSFTGGYVIPLPGSGTPASPTTQGTFVLKGFSKTRPPSVMFTVKTDGFGFTVSTVIVVYFVNGRFLADQDGVSAYEVTWEARRATTTAPSGFLCDYIAIGEAQGVV